MSTEKWLSRFAFMESTGSRWWSVGGAVYMIEAIKRVSGMHVIHPAWQQKTARERRLAVATRRAGAEPLRLVK